MLVPEGENVIAPRSPDILIGWVSVTWCPLNPTMCRNPFSTSFHSLVGGESATAAIARMP
jgi:hypothetical protein